MNETAMVSGDFREWLQFKFRSLDALSISGGLLAPQAALQRDNMLLPSQWVPEPEASQTQPVANLHQQAQQVHDETIQQTYEDSREWLEFKFRSLSALSISGGFLATQAQCSGNEHELGEASSGYPPTPTPSTPPRRERGGDPSATSPATPARCERVRGSSNRLPESGTPSETELKRRRRSSPVIHSGAPRQDNVLLPAREDPQPEAAQTQPMDSVSQSSGPLSHMLDSKAGFRFLMEQLFQNTKREQARFFLAVPFIDPPLLARFLEENAKAAGSVVHICSRNDTLLDIARFQGQCGRYCCCVKLYHSERFHYKILGKECLRQPGMVKVLDMSANLTSAHLQERAGPAYNADTYRWVLCRKNMFMQQYWDHRHPQLVGTMM